MAAPAIILNYDALMKEVEILKSDECSQIESLPKILLE